MLAPLEKFTLYKYRHTIEEEVALHDGPRRRLYTVIISTKHNPVVINNMHNGLRIFFSCPFV